MAAIEREEFHLLLLLWLWILVCSIAPIALAMEGGRVIEVMEEPKSVIWVVQLSDLHFSVFHPDRADDFRRFVPPSLSIINPSLVFITGDLTDSRSKDMFTMLQNEDEWVEYHNVLEDTIKRSGLDKNIFYDFRGNHDKFGVKDVGGVSDFFSKYAVSPQLGRSNDVNSVTIETFDRKHLFVTIDTSMSPGLRGTNLMGHPTDLLLDAMRQELSQWDSGSAKPVSKIALGHFPLSFSTSSPTQNTLKHAFFNHSLSLYLCGHLHSKFGNNLKRLHHPAPRHITSSSGLPPHDFWEWEVADWRKSRVMRILAVDHGQLSLLDIDLSTGPAKTIVLPTSPPDSRFFSPSPPPDTIRALVFSASPVRDVVARVYDSISGSPTIVLELTMVKEKASWTRGDLFTSGWNPAPFSDPSPDRYWLQVEVSHISGDKYRSYGHPFSVNGLVRQVPLTWKEFMVMGFQWADIYYPLFWSSMTAVLILLFFCKALVFLRRTRSRPAFALGWGAASLAEMHIFWYSSVCYCLYLISFPWFYGVPLDLGSERMYMTYRGWAHSIRKTEFFGSPDVMVIVLPHIVMVLFPAVLLSAALATEQWACSGKKEDGDKRHLKRGSRWGRHFLVAVSLMVLWTHYKSCYGLMRAYEMNPFLHFPVFCFGVPTLLGYVLYNTQ